MNYLHCWFLRTEKTSFIVFLLVFSLLSSSLFFLSLCLLMHNHHRLEWCARTTYTHTHIHILSRPLTCCSSSLISNLTEHESTSSLFLVLRVWLACHHHHHHHRYCPSKWHWQNYSRTTLHIQKDSNTTRINQSFVDNSKTETNLVKQSCHNHEQWK